MRSNGRHLSGATAMSNPPHPVRQIPSTVEKIDLDTGEKKTEGMAWNVMPPPAGCCQICAVKHDPGEPHNQQSFYYRMVFNGIAGRSPTWADALVHCSDEMKLAWEKELRVRGAWSEPPNGERPIKHHGAD